MICADSFSARHKSETTYTLGFPVSWAIPVNKTGSDYSEHEGGGEGILTLLSCFHL